MLNSNCWINKEIMEECVNENKHHFNKYNQLDNCELCYSQAKDDMDNLIKFYLDAVYEDNFWSDDIDSAEIIAQNYALEDYCEVLEPTKN